MRLSLSSSGSHCCAQRIRILLRVLVTRTSPSIDDKNYIPIRIYRIKLSLHVK
ncbi:hypothetical protein OIU79_002917 [Salix purpurea]|uniref:Uncharacterized protein n=1 Tax=Salix purpurea TaxID=77065 RepID=A0A9Q0ZEQ7_SALPP|nr:hypothetical protein OIU79_002917 [Salix purpurea]